VCCKETRQSNPQTGFCNRCVGLQLEHSESSRAARAQHSAAIEGHFLSLNDTPASAMPPPVIEIATVWVVLPPHTREAIVTLIPAGVASSNSRASDLPKLSSVEAMAWRVARECREVVQSCLREEEWAGADREFFKVIVNGITQLKSVIEIE
jgi:hypothetical protein